jgi:hypothetical protein
VNFKNADHSHLIITWSLGDLEKPFWIGSFLNPKFPEITLFGGNLGKAGIVELTSSCN